MRALTSEELVAIAQLATVLIAAVAVLVSLHGLRQQLWLQTFAEYTRRYSAIMEGLPFEARRPGGRFDTEALPVDQREKVLGIMRQYLNLCSEEFYLFEQGRIDRKTWGIWKTGMRDSLRLPCFAGGWAHMRDEYDFFPEFRRFMDELPARPSPSRPARTGT